MTDLIRGFVAFFRATGFLFQKRLAWVYLIPLVLYVLLLSGSMLALVSVLSEYMGDLIFSATGTNVELLSQTQSGKWYGFLFSLLKFGQSAAIAMLVFYLSSRTMKYVILIVCSPLLAWISEKSETMITGREYPFSLPQFASDVLRSVLLSCRNFLLELLLSIAGIVLSFLFPPAAFLFAILVFLVNCYFMGFSMFDYIAERRLMGFGESIRTMRKHRGMVVGLGLAFNLLALIPFADWAIAPVNGAVGAVLAEEGRFNSNG